MSAATELQAGCELNARVAELLEPHASLPRITAHEARLQQWGPDPLRWTWYSVAYLDSPGGWWQAHIGTDHGPGSADREPVRWFPSTDREPSEDIAAAWRVIDDLIARGWFPCVQRNNWSGDPWECNAVPPLDALNGHLAFGHGATPALAICRAALAALEAS